MKTIINEYFSALNMYVREQGQQAFSKGQMVNVLVFTGYLVSVTTLQLCYYIEQAATDDT